MKKLDNKEFYIELGRIKEMAKRPHEDYEVQLILADLYSTLSEGFIWEFPKLLWREYQIKKVIKLHKNCCDLED